MFKTKQEIIVIQAEAKEPIQTRAVFWSHDKGTAKMIFELQKNHVDQSLATGTKVPILLEFDSATAENGRGKHTYFATIDDAVNGIVSIVLEDNILGYVGRVEGSIYIELPDSRSLDTAGRFTFDIKRSPIDENVPELEDYYWQGFSEIMEQYNESIAEIKSEAKALLDSLTADVTTAKTKVTQLEQSITTANTNLNARIDEINKKIDDNDVFTKAESSANVIYQVIGKDTTKIKGTTNFKFKIAGSLEENPHWAGAANVGEELENPYYLNTEVTQDRYDSLSEIDDNYISVLANNSNVRAALCLKIDFLETVKQLLGENYFSDLGATSKSQELAILNMIVTNFNVGAYAKGVSNNGGVTNNRVSSKVWFDDLRWTAGTQTNETNSIKRLAHWKDTIYEVSRYLNADGVMQLIVFSDLRDDSNQTGIFVDYFDLNIDLNLSANKHLKSLIATNRVENLATQEEAESGTDNAKTMTPLRTAQQINKKAVTIAGNQTIGGIKNFKDGLMINGDNIVGINDRSLLSISPTNVSIFADGSGTFIKHGAMVIVQGAVKFKQAVSYGSLITNALPTEFSATFNNGIIVGHSTSNSAKSMYVERGTTNIKANSNFDANEWFTFNGIYWTGEGE